MHAHSHVYKRVIKNILCLYVYIFFNYVKIFAWIITWDNIFKKTGTCKVEEGKRKFRKNEDSKIIICEEDEKKCNKNFFDTFFIYWKKYNTHTHTYTDTRHFTKE